MEDLAEMRVNWYALNCFLDFIEDVLIEVRSSQWVMCGSFC